ncbi:MAG: STAS domain protein [candidate division BRC1 bacterium ADurb.BinA364]|nr:MAG: STAS domain protein [candidate division BRC1 bacterium ADurb.BinA364]
MNSNLTISVYKNEDTVYLAPSGRIIAENCAKLKRAGEVHFSSRLERFIVFMGEVDFIDSSGLGILVRLKVRCAEDKVKFIILSPSAQVGETLSVARLDAIFDIVVGAEAETLRRRYEVEDNLALARDIMPDDTSDAPPKPIDGEMASSETWGDAPRAKEKPAVSANQLCKDAADKVRVGQYEDAAELYERALRAEPDFMPALNNLAIVYEKKPQWLPRAIEMWERVLEISQRLDDKKHGDRAERRLAQLRKHPKQ